MLAFLNILYLLLPVGQTGSEAGVEIITGPNLEFTKIESPENQNYFFEKEDNQIGFHYGLGGYYNYYFENDYYLGLKFAYRKQNTTILEYEQEVINIEGQAVDGEFEHYFDYNLELINLFLKTGYRLNQRFALELGMLYALPISDYQIYSKETIVKPEDAGVFKEEGTRIRNEQRFSIPSNNSKLGVTFGLNGIFPMNRNETVFLKPSISYNYLLSENLNNLNSWNTDYVDFSVGVSFVLGENDIFAENIKIIEPIIDIVLFGLDGTIESPLKGIEVGYMDAKGLLNTKDTKMIIKSDLVMVSYVGIKELQNREATFYVKSKSKELYRVDNLEKSNRFEINLDILITRVTQNELQILVEVEDEFDKSNTLDIEFKKEGAINFLLSKKDIEILEYMKKNNSRKFDLYTDDKKIYTLLRDYNISNLTIQSKLNFPYHFEEFENSNYILIIE